MGYDEMCEDWNEKEAVIKVNVKKWLKQEEKWYKKDKK